MARNTAVAPLSLKLDTIDRLAAHAATNTGGNKSLAADRLITKALNAEARRQAKEPPADPRYQPKPRVPVHRGLVNLRTSRLLG